MMRAFRSVKDAGMGSNGGEFAKFCGLLRIYELSDQKVKRQRLTKTLKNLKKNLWHYQFFFMLEAFYTIKIIKVQCMISYHHFYHCPVKHVR